MKYTTQEFSLGTDKKLEICGHTVEFFVREMDEEKGFPSVGLVKIDDDVHYLISDMWMPFKLEDGSGIRIEVQSGIIGSQVIGCKVRVQHPSTMKVSIKLVSNDNLGEQGVQVDEGGVVEFTQSAVIDACEEVLSKKDVAYHLMRPGGLISAAEQAVLTCFLTPFTKSSTKYGRRVLREYLHCLQEYGQCIFAEGEGEQ